MMLSPLISKLLAQAQANASYSWEYGVVFSALLEYHDPTLSTFDTPFPDGRAPETDVESVVGLQYVREFIRLEGDELCDGMGASADPVSLGIPALLLSQSKIHNSTQYASAVDRQLRYLLSVPRFANGAISHRDDYASLWADFVYMVPPFLAYYGVFADNFDLIKEAVGQCERYAEILGTQNGCWKHIVNREGVDGVKVDEGLWSTSNGWVAAGIARVLATLRKSKYVSSTKDKQVALVNLARRIIDGAMNFDTDPSGLLRNRLDDETWFGEAAGTALLAAATFRMAVLEPGAFSQKYTTWASKKMEVVTECVDKTTGIVAPVVNPVKDDQETPLDGVSPEAQAFVVLLCAAHRDWKAANGHNTLQQ